MTHATPLMIIDAPIVTQGKEPAMAIILDAEDAMTVARTRAQALAC